MRGVPRERRAISFGAFVGEREADHPRAAPHDPLELGYGIEIEPHRNAEAVAQRRRQQAGAGRRADQGESGEVDLDRARRRPGADDQVELEVLHRRIENFLDRRVEAMDLVDEQHVARLEIGELGGEVAGLGDHRPRGGAEVDAELARDDLRQRRLAQPRRADEQHVVERLAARLRRFDEHLEIGARRLLAGEVGERLRAQRRVVLRALFGGDEAAGRRGHLTRLPRRGGGRGAERAVRRQADQARRHRAGEAGDGAAGDQRVAQRHVEAARKPRVDPRPRIRR